MVEGSTGAMLEYSKEGREKDSVASISNHLKQAQEIAFTIGIGDLLHNEKHIELIVADLLEHKCNPNTRGADAYDGNGDMVEYKSINLSTKSSGKSGGSFQFHWISKAKLDSYRLVKDVYFILRHGVIINEVWKLPMDIVFPDFEKSYEKSEAKRLVLNADVNSNKNKDKNIDAHKSYVLSTVKKLGAVLVYSKEVENNAGV